jgi:hypothetical protein
MERLISIAVELDHLESDDRMSAPLPNGFLVDTQFHKFKRAADSLCLVVDRKLLSKVVCSL